MELEHRVNVICGRIEADGVPFDDTAAARLERQWTADCSKLEARLREQFPALQNPSSRAQVAAQLEARGWIPEERTEKTGQPKINDELLETIPQLYPEFSNLAKLYIIKRRIAQLSQGAKAWRKHIGKDGHIHGGIVHIGTPHSRASHFTPNLAQVPNPKRGTPFAIECRRLFQAPAGWVFVAADQATLQDRTFAHYLTEFDHGAYAEAFMRGDDQHWKGAITLDLVPAGTARDKQNKVHELAREGAKSFRYGFLFGAQNKRAGQILYKIVRGIQHADASSDLYRRFFKEAARPSEGALTQVGKRARDKFEAATPGLRQLRQSLQNHAHRYGWLPGLDGRRVPVRAMYSSLNFIVTSAEAIICKRWLSEVYDELCARFRYGWDGDVVIALWIHDEIACCCRPEIAAEVGEIMVRRAKGAGKFYDLKVPLDADYKIGRDWAGAPVEAPIEGPIDQAPPSRDHDANGDKGKNDQDGHPSLDVDDDDVVEAPIVEAPSQIDWGGLLEQDFPRAFATAPPPQEEPAPPPRIEPLSPGGNGRANGGGYHGGNGFDATGSKSEAERDTHAKDRADKPFADTSLLRRGYRLAHVFDYTLADATLLYKQNRYELHPELLPTEGRPRKRFLVHRIENGRDVFGAGSRHVIYNWPAVMRAGPGSTVIVTEGEKNADALIKAGLLATTVLSHKWTPECVAALTGYHLIILADHDEDGGWLASIAQKALAPVAASTRIVPALHLWKHLPGDRRPELKDDVQDWIELGGDPAKLFDICREIPAEDATLGEWNAGDDVDPPPPRGWLLGNIFARRFVSSLYGDGGTGKTALRYAQYLELATARQITGEHIFQRCRVLIVSLEDDDRELRRRIRAARFYHKIELSEVNGWLFLSAPGAKVGKLVELDDKGRAFRGALASILEEAIARRQIDLVALDPFVKTHAVEENVNKQIDAVVEVLTELAIKYDIAVDTPHHTRKGPADPGNADRGRGASAQKDAGRLIYTLTTMSAEEAKAFGIEDEERHALIRMDSGKVNIAPKLWKAKWFQLIGVQLDNATELYPNGDNVQTIEPWIPPDIWEDMDADTIRHILDRIDAGLPDGSRYSDARSAKTRAAWRVVVEEVPEKTEAQAREIIKVWVKKGLLKSEEYPNPKDRKLAGGLRATGKKGEPT
jgi:DNA polymerase I-like protein with 3'-5' exonuclease and polymerase domains